MPSKMPDEMIQLLNYLQIEVDWLRQKWIMQCQIFNQETSDLLNDSANVFFLWAWNALGDDIHLTLCRLTDGATTTIKKTVLDNMTFHQLQKQVEEGPEENLKPVLKTTLDHLNNAVETSRIHRNKRIAHSDLATSYRQTELPAPDAEKINESIRWMMHVLNEVRFHYDPEAEPESSVVASGSGDGQELIRWLRVAQRAMTQMQS